jgi:hypothetical protein
MADVTHEFDFFETPVAPYTLLTEGAEVTIHVRNAATMEQGAVRGIVSRNKDGLKGNEIAQLNCYGRLGVRIDESWYMAVLEHLDDAALATDHTLAQSLDIEQGLKAAEQFKKSRYRKDKDKET